MESLLTREEAAALINRRPSWLRYAERHKLVPFVRVGGRIRYRATDLARWIEERAVREEPRSDDRTGGQP
jgi:hypothetical protein